MTAKASVNEKLRTERLVRLANVGASRYAGRGVRVKEFRYDRSGLVSVDMKLTQEMAQRIALCVNRIAREALKANGMEER